MSDADPSQIAKTLTYASYLRVDELLELQTPESAEHDELLFVVIHQVYELWFKQLLHEMDFLQTLFHIRNTPRIHHTFTRMLKILKTVVAQVDVLETMTPLEFGSFRERLGSASGFQSYQFRELEFALGYKRETMLEHYPVGSAGRARLAERYRAPTLWDAFLRFIAGHGYSVPEECLERDVTVPIRSSADLQALLVHVYHRDPDVAEVCERMVDLDEGMQEWRYRHVKMVERTIGRKRGTGGSSGVDYLKTTLTHLFPDLWAIRSQL